MQLRRRLLALVCLVLALSLVAGGVMTYWHGVRKIDTELDSVREVGATYMRDALVGIESSPEAETHLFRIVRAFDGDRHIKVRLVAPDGRTIALSRVGVPSDPAPQWLANLLSRPSNPAEIDMPAGLRKFGRIHFEAEPDNEISEVWEDAKLKLLIIGGFCGLVVALMYATLGRALRPLESLSTALARVGKGDYRVQVDEDGPIELKIIYKAFNGMAEDLDRSERQNRRLAEQLSTVQEEERNDIARDLHDEIGPFLFAVDADAQTIPPLLDKGDSPEVLARTKAIRQSVGHMQKHLRSVLSRLRPALLLDLGLTHAVDQLVAFWKTRRPSVTFTTDVTQGRVPPHIEEVAFRILQEGTSNAIRHGKPSHIDISARITDDGLLLVEVLDDGIGLKSGAGGGFGLKGMAERVQFLGGRLQCAPREGRDGVLLKAEIPLPPSAERVIKPVNMNDLTLKSASTH